MPSKSSRSSLYRTLHFTQTFCVWRTATWDKKQASKPCLDLKVWRAVWLVHKGLSIVSLAERANEENLRFNSCVQGVGDCSFLWELQIFHQCHRPFIVKSWIYPHRIAMTAALESLALQRTSCILTARVSCALLDSYTSTAHRTRAWYTSMEIDVHLGRYALIIFFDHRTRYKRQK